MKQGLVWSLVAGFLCSLQGAKVRSGSLRKNESSTDGSKVDDSDFCPGNKFPLDPRETYVLPTLEKGTDIFLDGQLSSLQNALEAADDWSQKVTWQLSLKATSSATSSAKIEFAGGDKVGLFLGFTVPAGVKGKELYTFDDVRIPGKEVHLVYSGAGKVPAGAITITDICLTPRLCTEADYCDSPGWKNKSGNSSLIGNSIAECCEPDLCSRAKVNCTPSTKWSTPDDFASRFGNTKDQCCMPRWCDFDSVCNETTTQAKTSGKIQGSTKGECCKQTYCKDYKCSKPTQLEVQPYLVDGSLRVGSTDDECCAELLCEEFDCAKDVLGMWKNKSNPSGRGSTFTECCDKQYCGNFTCGPSSKWTNRSDKASLPGHSLDACCHPEMCAVYTCSEGWVKVGGNKSMKIGSSDEECCERKLCSTYTCSDKTMWVKKANSSNLPGSNDTQCCDKKMCSDLDCRDSAYGTKWTSKNSSELRGLQGSTPQQCCDPRFCRDFSCTSDSDGDGNGTKWYRKVDTNTHEWMGTTDEECCVPRYCSYYNTSLPLTQWSKRTTPGLLGSTEEECYDPITCVDFNCTAHGMEAYPKPADYQGSTPEECCFKISSS